MESPGRPAVVRERKNAVRQAQAATFALSDELHEFADTGAVPGPRSGKFYGDVDTVVCGFPILPKGSSFEDTRTSPCSATTSCLTVFRNQGRRCRGRKRHASLGAGGLRNAVQGGPSIAAICWGSCAPPLPPGVFADLQELIGEHRHAVARRAARPRSTGCSATSPGAEGLFQRAIIQSGFALMDLPAGALVPGSPGTSGSDGSPRPRPKPAVRRSQPRWAAPIQPRGWTACAGWVCRSSSRSNGRCRSRTTTAFCPNFRRRALREGRFHRVPVMSGSTRDEHRLFVGLFRVLANGPVSTEQYPALLAEAFGDSADQVRRRYPLSAYESPSVAWATVLTDRMWARSTFEQHRLLADRVLTYAYEFADRHAPMYLPFAPDLPPGAFHAADVPYLFSDDTFEAHATRDQRRLSRQMIRYWANFARTGDPNGDVQPPWPPFDGAAEVPHVQSLSPDTGAIKPVDYAAAHQLGFWSEVRA